VNPTRNDLSLEIRQGVCQILNQRLAEMIDLQLQSKQAHWNIRGSNFLSLHELFDDLAEALADPIDSIAERITALGGIAEGTLAHVSGRTSLPAYPDGLRKSAEVLAAIADALARCARTMRASIDHADQLGDAGTADLFTGISRELDKRLWFVEAHI
jgi:starvation-inducible DNA-binding protein